MFLTGLGVATYSAVLTYVTWIRFETFGAATFDLGISVQLANTILQTGLPLQTPNWVISGGAISQDFFGVHVSLVRYLFAGIYWLYRDPVTLLSIQAVAVGLGSVPVYKLSMHLLDDRKTSTLLSFSYLLFPPLIMSNLYDFHEEALLPLAVIGGYYFFLRKRFLLASLAFVFTAFIQEAATLLLFFVGLQLLAFNPADFRRLFTERRWNAPGGLAVILIVCSPIVYLLDNIIITSVNPAAGFIATSSTAYGLSLLNASSNLLQKGVYWLTLLLFAALLPLSVKRSLILAVPWFVVSVFGDNPAFSVFSWQYTFYVVPALFIGIIYGLRRLSNLSSLPVGAYRWSRVSGRLYRIIPLLFIFTGIILTPLYPLIVQYFPTSRSVDYYTLPSGEAQLQQLFQLIPVGASVLASDFVFAHVATSIGVYPIIYGFNSSTRSWYLDTYLPIGFSPAYIVIFGSDYSAAASLVPGFPGSYGLLGEVTVDMNQVSSFSQYQLVKESVILYRQNYSGPPAVFLPYSSSFDYHGLRVINGSYVSDLSSPSKTVLFHPSGGLMDTNFWLGPVLDPPVQLPPGMYKAGFYLRLGSSTSAPPNGYVLTLVVRSAEQPAGAFFASVALTAAQLTTAYTQVLVNFTLTSPASDLSFSGIDASPQYGVYLDHIVVTEISAS